MAGASSDNKDVSLRRPRIQWPPGDPERGKEFRFNWPCRCICTARPCGADDERQTRARWRPERPSRRVTDHCYSAELKRSYTIKWYFLVIVEVLILRSVTRLEVRMTFLLTEIVMARSAAFRYVLGDGWLTLREAIVYLFMRLRAFFCTLITNN